MRLGCVWREGRREGMLRTGVFGCEVGKGGDWGERKEGGRVVRV